MKRIASIVIALSFILLAFSFTASAAMSASFTGPSTVRAGDTITLTFSLDGSGVEGASGTLSYDSSQLTLSGTKQSIASPWAVEFSGNNMVAYDNDLSKPINKSTKLLTATFKVKTSVAVGTTVKVSFNDVRISDGKNETKAGTVSYTATIAEPLSGDCSLASLTVSNATISPAFDTNTTEYTANVPFEVSKLNVQATAGDAKSKVTVNSPDLAVNGTTDVTVTVKAASGATRVYTIKVTRAQDPNYVPAGDNALADLSVQDFFISPKFDSAVDKYVVWLPFETESITVNATPKDPLATFRVEGGESLTAGVDNEVKVICVAENGTEKVYTVIAKRAADPAATTDTPVDPVTTNTDTTDAPAEKAAGLNPILLIPIVLVALGAGFAVGLLIGKKKK